MYTRRWHWTAGCLMAASVALIGCGDDGGGGGGEVDAGGPADGGASDAQGCPTPDDLWEDVDLQEFTPLVEVEALDVAGDVMLAEAATYWEMRRATPGNPIYAVVLSAGEKCAEAEDAEVCRQEFDDLSSEMGFGLGCLPGLCYQYIAVNRGDTHTIIASVDELVAFLGNIDTPTEAALVAFAHGYGWDAGDASAGSIRPVEEGYELLVTELTQDCDPVVTDRVQLIVATDGTVTVSRRQTYNVLCGGCI